MRGQQAAAGAARGMLDGVLEPPKEAEVAIRRGLLVAEEASMGGGRGQVDQVSREGEGWPGGSSREPLAVAQSCHHRGARKSCPRLDWKSASEQGVLKLLIKDLMIGGANPAACS